MSPSMVDEQEEDEQTGMQVSAKQQIPQQQIPQQSTRAPPFTAFSPAFLLERCLSSASLPTELTEAEKTALILALRDEVLSLRRQVQESKGSNLGMHNLRYRMSIAPAVAEAAAARAAAAAIVAAQQTEVAVPASSSSLALVKSSPAKQSPAKSTPAKSSPTMHSTPQQQVLPPASSSVSPSPASWGLTSLFGTVKRALIGPGRSEPTPSMTTTTDSTQQYIQSPTPSKQYRSSVTPSRSHRSSSKLKTPKTPTVAESPVDETPLRTERRRGTLPGSIRVSRKTPAKTPGRTPGAPPKPLEPNADRRFEQIQQAAERKRIQEQAEKIEEEKRQVVEEQKKLDEADAARHEVGNKRKRVRVDDLKHIPASRPGQSGTFGLLDEFFDQNSDSDEDDYVEMDVDEIEIVTPRPNKKMRLDENVFLPPSPAKQSPAPTTPATPLPDYARIQEEAVERQRSRATVYKPRRPSNLRQMSTGSPNNNATLASSSPDLQLPETPEIISSSPFASMPNTPSAAPVITPLPPTSTTTYIEVPHTVLSDITERTEPESVARFAGLGRASVLDTQRAYTPMSTTSEHPEVQNFIITPTPASRASNPSGVSLAAPLSAPAELSRAPVELELDLNWPAAVNLWPGRMHLVEKLPITIGEQAESDRSFAAGAADRLWREQNGLASTTEIPGF